MAESQPETYSVHPKSRGNAFIITNKDFRLLDVYKAAYDKKEISDPTRYGARVEQDKLQYVFGTKLKFNCRTFMNVNKYHYQSHEQDFWIHDTPPTDKKDCQCISCKIQTMDHSGLECFVLAISTHGLQIHGKQHILFADDFLVDRVKLADIIETLKDENCKTLKGIPRIIILNMCRTDPYVPAEKQGEVYNDDGHEINGKSGEESVTDKFETMGFHDIHGGAGDLPNQDIQSGGQSRSDDVNQDAEHDDSQIEDNEEQIQDDEANDENYYYGTEEALKKMPSNFLIVFSCVPGKYSFHPFSDGSWLIDELWKVVRDHDFIRFPEMNFLSVLTRTAGQVAVDRESETGKKSTVCIVHRLLKPIIFKDVAREDGENIPALYSNRGSVSTSDARQK